ncbi:MAG: formate dehydrogenase accessory sulfurtransferase FdhD [Chloroflexi bacterium]|nr:formate dehydrogenase accessory sulfurtransferase FdhD [Chloroflexota bacterium]
MEKAKSQLSYYEVYNDQYQKNQGEVIVEAPVSLTVNGETWFNFMCTPVDLDTMAIGFLYNEGLIDTFNEVASVRVCPGNENVDVWLTHSVKKPEYWNRTSGCTGGIISVNIENEGEKPIYKPNEECFLCPQDVHYLIRKLFESQILYKSGGGVHTSALSDGEKILYNAEDIGRHNTLDKLAGKRLLSKKSTTTPVCITTGRISSDMIQKAIRMNSVIVISRTSPSSLSVKLAEQSGITLIGYARRDRFNIYTHNERILVGTPCLDYRVYEISK